ncbi:transcription-repair coupling factor (superfamily II helicase) [Thiovulum sp. ES]|nr:transcription-repair coupling factor (superfamily II helicase) [Thiovulum sp. ES]
MTRLQKNLLEFLEDKNRIDILITSNNSENFQAEQVLKYLKISFTTLPDFRAVEFDDLISYREEILQIQTAIWKHSKNGGVLIIPQRTMQNPIPKANLLKSKKISFGEEFQIDLEDFGYKKVDIVLERGEFLENGNGLDIFPINTENPYRIKFEGSEISHIQEFSELTQRFIGDEVEDFELVPAIPQIAPHRKIEIENKILNSEFNTRTPDFESFGLWFLNEEETFKIPQKASIRNLSDLPDAVGFYDIEFETKQARKKKSKIILDELEIGEYVVHSDYGIGLFEGLSRERVLGVEQDFVRMKYQGDSHLLVPIGNLHYLSRYISSTGKVPKVDKLGKGGFSKKSGKVRGKLAEIAKYIVDLSAKRRLISAPKIAQIDLKPLQRESGFKYTEDQEDSIFEITEGLQKGFPMDHLLIGDVGFGKTEVALNTIYFVAKNGFQSAFVVPTTILAKQHFDTLKIRLKNFGIQIAHIDRFTKLKEKREIQKKVESGEIDLVIGTHAILTFKFKNLALFIVDEEHKFGVKQKSQLQELYVNTHLLSMSATPIPRTLHQALSQIKTISKLETPPKERIGTRTFVKNYDEVAIKDAILRELKRNGQVFYIFNSIAEIENKKSEILRILPNLQIAVLHSKVPAKQMEDEIDKFTNNEYRILLATSIVGAGIHIPNVNTIIIEGADRFGIADLHQLRGRVGRSDREGFCHLFVEDFSEISEKAEQRLLALEKNSSLGVGSNLAKQDLEIRGGGNIAGESQSGHIDDVGYSLYIRMLEKEIEKLSKSGEVFQRKGVDIQLKIETYISTDLIPDDRIRLDIYRRVTNAENLSDVDEVEDEVFERFGKLDQITKQFFDIVKIRILSERKNISGVSNSGNKIYFTKLSGEREMISAETRDHDDILKAVFQFLEKS